MAIYELLVGIAETFEYLLEYHGCGDKGVSGLEGVVKV